MRHAFYSCLVQVFRRRISYLTLRNRVSLSSLLSIRSRMSSNKTDTSETAYLLLSPCPLIIHTGFPLIRKSSVRLSFLSSCESDGGLIDQLFSIPFLSTFLHIAFPFWKARIWMIYGSGSDRSEFRDVFQGEFRASQRLTTPWSFLFSTSTEIKYEKCLNLVNMI